MPEQVRLHRGHPSVWGRPVLQAVDPEIFRLRYFQPCLSCSFCRDQCCNHGVDIDSGNAERLLALGDAFEAYVGVPRQDWFTDQVSADEEFPSGHYRRTQTKDGACVFHVAGGRGCKIHAWCIEKSLDYHGLKPLVSALFPLTFEKGALVPSTEVLEGTLICATGGATLYEGVRDELGWFFGPGLVEELDAIRATQSAALHASCEGASPATR